MSDCSYAAMSNHKLTVANLCVNSNSMWTNFADNGKIHMCIYNVCTMYTTAVGVILARQLACFRYVFCSLRSHGTRDKAGSIIDRCYRERVSVDAFCSLRSHGTRLLLTQQSKPCLVMGKAGVCACVVISWTFDISNAERSFARWHMSDCSYVVLGTVS